MRINEVKAAKTPQRQGNSRLEQDTNNQKTQQKNGLALT
jgi:hypothetical protein